jgi:hypothetical protein
MIGLISKDSVMSQLAQSTLSKDQSFDFTQLMARCRFIKERVHQQGHQASSFTAWRAVLPGGTGLFCVGGIDADNLATFKGAGAMGAGLGSSLYTPGISSLELAQRAKQFQNVWRAAPQCAD